MFNVGGPEIMVVLLVALVVLGPEQLPKAMRTFGNVMAQIRKVSNGFQDEMRSAMNTLDPTSPNGSSQSGSNEVVARNVASDPAPAEGVNGPRAETPAPVVDPVSDRPGTTAADRAAG